MGLWGPHGETNLLFSFIYKSSRHIMSTSQESHKILETAQSPNPHFPSDLPLLIWGLDFGLGLVNYINLNPSSRHRLSVNPRKTGHRENDIVILVEQ